MTKQEKIKAFDPNTVGDLNNGIFGLPFTAAEADIVLLPVPWEVTVSYGSGTAKGPAQILEASYQVDLYDTQVKDAWKRGIAMLPISKKLQGVSNKLRKKSEKYIDALANGKPMNDKRLVAIRQEINQACKGMNAWVKRECLKQLDDHKVLGLIGGDHSTPLGMIQALAEKHGEFTILQIDAHADLRDAYEGFEYSHASIMYNALKIKEVKKLVQVGIRDYCEAELNIEKNSKGRVVTFYDKNIKEQHYAGKTWDDICNQIIKQLPNKIYLSFDIDGLDPKLCPNTGTPVSGGFEAEQVMYLLEKIVASGKQFIAFDMNEVANGPDSDWDANVAARMLYRICNLVAKSQNKK